MKRVATPIASASFTASLFQMKTTKGAAWAACCAVACTCLFPLTAGATQISFQQPVSGNWNVNTNWNPNTVPGSGDEAFIGSFAGSGIAQVTDSESVFNVDVASQFATELQILTGGTLTVGNVVTIAENNVTGGIIRQSGGALVDGAFFVGNVGSGTYILSGGTSNANTMEMGANFSTSIGNVNQSGGTNTASNLEMGLPGTGTYTLSGTGILNVIQNYYGTGVGGHGTLTQMGGTYNPDNINLGANTSAVGIYNSTGGILNMPTAQNFFLGEGTGSSGTWNIGDASGTVTINNVNNGGTGVALVVRQVAGATGTINGWGTIPFTGPNFTNNGRIIANGYGTARTLDLSSFSTVNNTIENIAANGSTNNGYFAINHGILALPAIKNITANTRNWGESDNGSVQTDSQIDLVNSAQLTFGGTITNGGGGSGSLSISLLALDDVTAPGITSPVGEWQFVKNGGLGFGSLGLTFRYDDVLAGGNASNLKLFYKVPGTNDWTMIPSSVDTVNDLLTTSSAISGGLFGSGTSPTDFLIATAVPEPASLALMIMGGVGLLRRTNRRRTKNA